MITICAVCQDLITQISPLDDTRISHGLCRTHALEALLRAEIATGEEKSELASIYAKRVMVQVLVPDHVAFKIEAHREDREKMTGQRQQFADVAGMMLTRETHRTEWADMVPTT